MDGGMLLEREGDQRGRDPDSHPSEACVELQQGGWTAEAVAAAWHDRLAPSAQRSGVSLPALELV